MSPSTNPANLKNQLAHRFVRALNNLNHKKPGADHDQVHNIKQNQMYTRINLVKIAAYTAMASVVGSRRAWSRAVLRRIRNRSRNQGLFLRNRKRVYHKITDCHHHAKRLRNPNPKRQDFNLFRNSSQELKLRKLVPGARTIDSWCLVSETADYIKCLVAQVEVMKTLVDLYATT
ncbi:transcription factor IBH1-like [Bidens hawaiensis]|uniref:transcription factor IBH1-like n=1 Tax=Bidens hawaiensis TaxID=980011 RepID=UPI004049193C